MIVGGVALARAFALLTRRRCNRGMIVTGDTWSSPARRPGVSRRVTPLATPRAYLADWSSGGRALRAANGTSARRAASSRRGCESPANCTTGVGHHLAIHQACSRMVAGRAVRRRYETTAREAMVARKSGHAVRTGELRDTGLLRQPGETGGADRGSSAEGLSWRSAIGSLRASGLRSTLSCAGLCPAGHGPGRRVPGNPGVD